ncbi:MAG: hypothetical protein K8U57_31380 [Planctomycetes bacterium]|nr:hypothetical protein [Planctomycetota bacterium]
MPVQTMTRRTHRMPPHCTTAERVILAGMMKDSDETIPPMVMGGLVVEDFYHHAHQLVFTTLLDLFNRFASCGPFDLYRTLERRGELAELGHDPAGWVFDLWHVQPWFSGIERWWADDFVPPDVSLFTAAPIAAARLIQWLAQRRAAIHAANELLRDARDGSMSPSDARVLFLCHRLGEIRSDLQPRAAA